MFVDRILQSNDGNFRERFKIKPLPNKSVKGSRKTKLKEVLVWMVLIQISQTKVFKYKHLNCFISQVIHSIIVYETTLPITLNNDLKKLVATKLELTTQTDLDTLRLIAEDRPKWNALVAEIRKTAEAARSDDPASGRL
ncbi:hypothetical protein PoB_006080200 [Plakobranchus ocellatus]|uniref:Uncharacterized protein n=1 Tax=Plakobranchus ocellatus TaxID=259542 RepID=A0AAV4CQZ0_9GAST|nr:hypothetical protein PoB_006080200 [Plakobranchus ocellatus]